MKIRNQDEEIKQTNSDNIDGFMDQFKQMSKEIEAKDELINELSN